MAKVELIVKNGTFPGEKTSVKAGGDGGWVTPNHSEYASKVWEEYKTWTTIDELIKARKVVQRKLDAARKRFKRITQRLNAIEKNWAAV